MYYIGNRRGNFEARSPPLSPALACYLENIQHSENNILVAKSAAASMINQGKLLLDPFGCLAAHPVAEDNVVFGPNGRRSWPICWFVGYTLCHWTNNAPEGSLTSMIGLELMTCPIDRTFCSRLTPFRQRTTNHNNNIKSAPSTLFHHNSYYHQYFLPLLIYIYSLGRNQVWSATFAIILPSNRRQGPRRQ
jgi:hypothetical protein